MSWPAKDGSPLHDGSPLANDGLSFRTTARPRERRFVDANRLPLRRDMPWCGDFSRRGDGPAQGPSKREQDDISRQNVLSRYREVSREALAPSRRDQERFGAISLAPTVGDDLFTKGLFDHSLNFFGAMLDQTKTAGDGRRGTWPRRILGGWSRVEPGSGIGRRWTPRIVILSGLVLAILCDAFVAHVLSVN